MESKKILGLEIKKWIVLLILLVIVVSGVGLAIKFGYLDFLKPKGEKSNKSIDSKTAEELRKIKTDYEDKLILEDVSAASEQDKEKFFSLGKNILVKIIKSKQDIGMEESIQTYLLKVGIFHLNLHKLHEGEVAGFRSWIKDKLKIEDDIEEDIKEKLRLLLNLSLFLESGKVDFNKVGMELMKKFKSPDLTNAADLFEVDDINISIDDLMKIHDLLKENSQFLFPMLEVSKKEKANDLVLEVFERNGRDLAPLKNIKGICLQFTRFVLVCIKHHTKFKPESLKFILTNFQKMVNLLKNEKMVAEQLMKAVKDAAKEKKVDLPSI